MFTMSPFIYTPSSLSCDKNLAYWAGGLDGSTKAAPEIETPCASRLGAGPRIQSLR